MTVFTGPAAGAGGKRGAAAPAGTGARGEQARQRTAASAGRPLKMLVTFEPSSILSEYDISKFDICRDLSRPGMAVSQPAACREACERSQARSCLLSMEESTFVRRCSRPFCVRSACSFM